VKILPLPQFGKYNLYNVWKMRYIVDCTAMYLTT